MIVIIVQAEKIQEFRVVLSTFNREQQIVLIWFVKGSITVAFTLERNVNLDTNMNRCKNQLGPRTLTKCPVFPTNAVFFNSSCGPYAGVEVTR